MTKGILKRHSLSGVSIASSSSENTDSGSQEDFPKAKRVSFDGAEPARVFEADEWDRSPAEITLRLTYKDVVELRELDVSLVRTGPLMMERTPSRRPTRQRTPTPPSTQRKESSSTDPPHRGSTPIGQSHFDESPSPVLPSSNPRLSPTYQYQAFSSQSLPPLLEDASSSPMSSPSPTERRGRGHSAPASDSYFTFHSAPTAGSPPGLPFRTPRLKGVSSPTLAPPSSLVLPSPDSPHSSSPKPSSRPVSPVPLYIHPRARPTVSLIKTQRISESSKPLVIPSLSRRASVPDELALETGKGAFTQSTLGRDSPSPTWKPMGLTGVNANASSPALGSSKNMQGSPPATPVVTRKNGKSLMGWELKRSPSSNGKLGFGLVRRGGIGA